MRATVIWVSWICIACSPVTLLTFQKEQLLYEASIKSTSLDSRSLDPPYAATKTSPNFVGCCPHLFTKFDLPFRHLISSSFQWKVQGGARYKVVQGSTQQCKEQGSARSNSSARYKVVQGHTAVQSTRQCKVIHSSTRYKVAHSSARYKVTVVQGTRWCKAQCGAM